MAENILQKRRHRTKRGASFWQNVKNNRSRLLMFLPGFLFILVFSYGPMYGLVLAFKEYNFSLGILESPWVGLKHFEMFFSSKSSMTALSNTVIISFLRLIFSFPAPIILALMLNELNSGIFKKVAQTVSYLPHFISWIVVAGVFTSLLSPSTGSVNYIIKLFGGDPVLFMTDTSWFRPILIVSGIWKEIGWGSVIYLAAMCSIPQEQNEAAVIDGATRMQRMRYITIPSMKSVISIMLLMQAGGIMNAGFDQVFNMYSPSVYDVGDIIDTYVYRVGIGQMMYGFNTAVGLFKSVVNFALVVCVNLITKRMNDGESVMF
ncbi:MAG: ABC transporter permease subunit [Oscillospiraceae bacterium]